MSFEARLNDQRFEIEGEILRILSEDPHIQETDKIGKLVKIVLDPSHAGSYRGIALGALANVKAPGEQILKILEAEAKEGESEETLALFKNAFSEIVLTKSRLEAAREEARPGVAWTTKPGIVHLRLPAQFEAAQKIVSMAMRQGPEPSLLHRNLLSARDEAATATLLSLL
jgi:hypothetical protein